MMIRATVALLVALLGGLPAADDWWPVDEWWETDPLACPEPGEPNCGAPNGAGGWEPEAELLEVAPVAAPAAEPAATDPTYTG